MKVTICMTNGGRYDNITDINNIGLKEINETVLMDLINSIMKCSNENSFIIIKFNSSSKAVLRINCISSINLE